MATKREWTEAEKMAAIPEIIFVTGPAGRRARIAEVGPDVWEVILTYHQCGDNADRLPEIYPHLSAARIAAALRYYELFPEEIDSRIKRNTSWTPEDIERLNARVGITKRSHTAAAAPPAHDRTAE